MDDEGILLNKKINKNFFLYIFKVFLKPYNFYLKNLFLSFIFRRYSFRKKNSVFFQKGVSPLKHELGHI